MKLSVQVKNLLHGIAATIEELTPEMQQEAVQVLISILEFLQHERAQTHDESFAEVEEQLRQVFSAEKKTMGRSKSKRKR